MHILFLTDNFPPEGNAPATRTFEHAKHWISAGHKVTVITGAPNFPEGKVYRGYKNSWYSKTNMDGIEVVRVKTYIAENKGFALRILDFISFMISSFFAGLFQKKVDVIVATSPQFFTAVSGWALSIITRKKFVFELRDIWPASITAVGAMKHSKVIWLLEKLEVFLYHQADAIVSVTHSFKEELISRGIDEKKISVVLNGVDLTKYQPINQKDENLSESIGIKEKFVVGYIGTHGLAHGLENVIAAAELLKDEPSIEFLFAGGGAQKEVLKELAKSKGLTNIKFLERQPKENMPKVWSLCDVSLISLKNIRLFETVIPSKIFESLAMGLPIVASIPNGEASELLSKTGASVYCEPESPMSLVDAIKYLEGLSQNDFMKLKETAAISAQQFERKDLAEQMLDTLKKL